MDGITTQRGTHTHDVENADVTDTNTQLCEPCKVDGESSQVCGFCRQCNQHLCRSCIKYHRRFKDTHQHDIVERQEPSGDVNNPDMIEICPIHSNKRVVVKFYCPKHEQICCGECLSEAHRSCKVESIWDASKNFDQNTMIKELLFSIAALEKRFERRRTAAVNVCQAKANCSKIALEDVKKFRAEMIEYLDQCEKELEAEIKEELKGDEASLHDIDENCLDARNRLAEIKTELRLNQTNIRHVFIKANRANNDIKILERKLKELTSEIDKSHCCVFEHERAFDDILSTKNPLGSLKRIKLEKPRDLDKLRNGTATRTPDIKVYCAEDESACAITSMVFIEPNRLLAADNANCIIKDINTSTKKLTSAYQMSCCPWDITVLPEEEIAITLCDAQKVRIVSISNKKLSKVREFPVSGSCYGIDYGNYRLVVSYCNPSKIEIMDTKGQISSSIRKDQNGYIMFSSPWYVAFSNDGEHIYVSDYCNFIAKLTIEGDKICSFKDKNLVSPTGLLVGADDTFLVCGSNSYNVNILSNDGQKSDTLLSSTDGLISPRAMCLTNDSNTLYVSSVKGATESNNFLQVYEFKNT